MIRFCCENCGCKIKAEEKNEGRKVKCPRCKNIVVVPEEIKLQNLLADKIDTEASNQSVSGTEAEIVETEPSGRRGLPWFFDIFLFPISSSGCMHIAIFTIIPFIGRFLSLAGFVLNALLGLYFGWYLTECVRDSAKGGTRAPEAFALMGLGEMWAQMQHIIGPYLIFLAPAFLYNIYAQKIDALYWSLLIAGSFLFPMGLLACIMFDSIRGLNPILLLGSIFSTFLEYCLIVLLVIGIVFAFISMSKTFGPIQMQKISLTKLVLDGAFIFLETYFAFVIAHLTGRFYWRNKEKLNWEC